jgi:Type IV secretion system pilin
MNTPTPDRAHAQAEAPEAPESAVAMPGVSGGHPGHSVAIGPAHTGRSGHPHPARPAGHTGHPSPAGQSANTGHMTARPMSSRGSAQVATDGGEVAATDLAAPSDCLSTVGPAINPDTEPIAVMAGLGDEPHGAALVLRVVGRLLLAMVLAGAVLVLAVGLGRWLLLEALAPTLPHAPAPAPAPGPVWRAVPGGVRGVVVLAQDQSGGVSLEQFLANLRTWIFRILGTLTATVLAIGGIRLAAANGEPEQVAKAKETIKSGAWGFVFTMLAPAFVTILQQLVGGSR